MTRNPMRSEGCCGVLKALQANSGTGVEILDLPVSVTPGRRGKGRQSFGVWYMNNKGLPEGFWLWCCCCPVRTVYGGNGPPLENMDTSVRAQAPLCVFAAAPRCVNAPSRVLLRLWAAAGYGRSRAQPSVQRCWALGGIWLAVNSEIPWES